MKKALNIFRVMAVITMWTPATVCLAIASAPLFARLMITVNRIVFVFLTR